MAGVCKQCGGETTNTRASSKYGLCFGCEHGGYPRTADGKRFRLVAVDKAQVELLTADAADQSDRELLEGAADNTLASLPLAVIEKQHIVRALRHFEGHIESARQSLDIGHGTIYRKLHEYGIRTTRNGVLVVDLARVEAECGL